MLRYLERCIEVFRSTLRNFAMMDIREYGEKGCEVQGMLGMFWHKTFGKSNATKIVKISCKIYP